MATDQKSSALGIDPESPNSVIENELPAYRAISTLAIYSLVCGGLAIFTWAHPIFYLASALAVVLGFLAHRAIGQYPDMLTGRGLASTGIALGLVFGLGCATFTGVQTYVRTNMAEKFAKHYGEVLQSAPRAEIFRLHVPPDGRTDDSGEQMLKQFETGSAKDKMMMDQKFGQLMALRKRLESSKEEHIEFVRVEAVGEDDSKGSPIPIFGFALYEVHGPGSEKFPEKQQYAMAIVKGRLKGKHYDWWVEEIRYPYIPQSYVAPVAAPDDGHGHAH